MAAKRNINKGWVRKTRKSQGDSSEGIVRQWSNRLVHGHKLCQGKGVQNREAEKPTICQGHAEWERSYPRMEGI